jgi:hypothetical protein
MMSIQRLKLTLAARRRFEVFGPASGPGGLAWSFDQVMILSGARRTPIEPPRNPAAAEVRLARNWQRESIKVRPADEFANSKKPRDGSERIGDSSRMNTEFESKMN